MWVFCSTNSDDNPVVNLDHIIAVEKFEDDGRSCIGFHKPMGYIEWSYKNDKKRDLEYDRLMRLISSGQ